MLPLALLLCGLRLAFAQGPFDPEGNSRPNNITGLWYRIYGDIGSYYNGSLTFKLDLRDRNADEDSDEYPGTTCHSFIDDSIELTYNALAGFTKNDPDWDATNPVRISLYGVDKDFNLTWPAAERQYSEYQEFELKTAETETQMWNFSLRNSSSSSYDMSGQISKDEELRGVVLQLNLTDPCVDESGASSNEDDYLFDGGMVTPHWNDFAWETWADSVPWPTIKAKFDEKTASVEMRGLFHLTAYSTAIVGDLSIKFEGSVDEARSDELLQEDKPEWNATLGFTKNLGEDSGAAADMATSRKCSLLIAMATMMVLGIWCL